MITIIITFILTNILVGCSTNTSINTEKNLLCVFDSIAFNFPKNREIMKVYRPPVMYIDVSFKNNSNVNLLINLPQKHFDEFGEGKMFIKIGKENDDGVQIYGLRKIKKCIKPKETINVHLRAYSDDIVNFIEQSENLESPIELMRRIEKDGSFFLINYLESSDSVFSKENCFSSDTIIFLKNEYFKVKWYDENQKGAIDW